MLFTVSDRQSLIDVALICLGSVAGVFDLARRNGLSVTASLADGQNITYEMDDVVSTRVRSAYAVQSVNPATDIPRRQYLELLYATGTKRPPVVVKPFDYIDNPDIVVDKIDQVIADLNAGRPVKVQSKKEFTRIFSDSFDEIFS